MDYKELLKKYMKHVVDEEGVTFVEWCFEPDFTLEEIKQLEAIENEL